MKISLHILTLAILLCGSPVVLSAEQVVEEESKSVEIDNESKVKAKIPERFIRPVPFIELGNEFLGSGTLSEGFEIFTGAIWQPSLVAFGTFRSAIQTQDDGNETSTEWVNRLDIFANLYLTSTERILIGFRPLDNKGEYSGYRFHDDEQNIDGLNNNITTLFFEGDFGELFPKLDVWDRKGYDVGFAIGRQPITFQEGIMINDSFDAIGITQNSLRPSGTSNLRVTGLYGWNNVNRANNMEDNSTDLYGLFTEVDFITTTIAVDLIYIDDDVTGDAYFLGLSAIQRIGSVNTAFRLLTSNAEDDSASASTGTLLFAEVGWAPVHTDDNFYVNGFIAFNDYTSAARRTEVGGPLGRAGILFAGPQIGTVGSALSNRASEVVGAVIGYQSFFGPLYRTRRQLIIEAGFRQDTNNIDEAAIAIGMRYQQALDKHYVVQLDGYLADYENRDDGYGLRVELLVKF